MSIHNYQYHDDHNEIDQNYQDNHLNGERLYLYHDDLNDHNIIEQDYQDNHFSCARR